MLRALLAALILPAAAQSGGSTAADIVFRPRVVVLAAFEIGKDTGDRPGEFQFWVERLGLTNSLAVPGVDRPLRYAGGEVLAGVIGATGRAGLQLMALGLDPRFDFRRTYWLTAGIAGVDPENASVGSAAWARWVVDGGIAYEIDSREAPADWPYGLVPVGSKRPNERPSGAAWAPKPMAWRLNPSLVDWAWRLTRDTVIPETDAARAHRARFTNSPAGAAPPRVLLGDSLGSDRYWHGAAKTRWANDWTRLHTDGEGDFVMTNMEDHALAAALDRLAGLGKVDFQRVLFLRTGSNYCGPHPGQASAESMTEEYSGMEPALEAAYLTGSRVVKELIEGWERYSIQTP